MITQEIKTELEKIFGQSPLPNSLKSRKGRFKRGVLGNTSIINILEAYSEYKVVLKLEKKD